MDKYNEFLNLVERIKADAAKMETVNSRKELEALEKDAMNCFKSLMVKAPYASSHLHDFASKQAARIATQDAQNLIKE